MAARRPHWSDKSVENPFPELIEWLKEYRPGWTIRVEQVFPPDADYLLSLHREDGPYVKYNSLDRCWWGMKEPLETARGFTTLKEAVWAAIHLHEEPECVVCREYRDWDSHVRQG